MLLKAAILKKILFYELCNVQNSTDIYLRSLLTITGMSEIFLYHLVCTNRFIVIFKRLLLSYYIYKLKVVLTKFLTSFKKIHC